MKRTPAVPAGRCVRRPRAQRSAARLAALLLAVAACADAPEPPESIGPIGTPLPGLDTALVVRFAEGRSLFNREFTPEEGLGPLYNQKRCSSCHDLPTLGGQGAEPITKATRWDGNRCDLLIPFGGDNIQEGATPLLVAAGTPYETIPDTANALAAIRPPPLFGAGLLDAIPDSTLLALADSADANGDGISGRPGRTADGRVGRFGKKAEFATLEDFVDGAIRFEMGLTTPAHPVEETVNGVAVPPETDPVAEPEIDAERLALLVDYVRFLAAPDRALPESDAVRDTIDRGERIFHDIGCAQCHVPSLRTAPNPIDALSERTVRLYSDLLLHDMGESLATACGIGATPSEWRTAPLYGLRHRLFFMHDGRAGGYDQAIRLHGGESTQSTNAYYRLDEVERSALFQFLASL